MVGAPLGVGIGVTIGAGKIFANLLIISFGVRGVTTLQPSIYARTCTIGKFTIDN